MSHNITLHACLALYMSVEAMIFVVALKITSTQSNVFGMFYGNIICDDIEATKSYRLMRHIPCHFAVYIYLALAHSTLGTGSVFTVHS